MNIQAVLSFVGGLAFFLYGMHALSTGLEKTAGKQLKQTLESMTSSLFKSLLWGTIITAAVQSSSAVTVMLVGLVNSGLMELSKSVGIIMGSNIGTTMTAWILSLVGIKSDNVWLNLLQPTSFAPILAIIGIAFVMFSKETKRRSLGEVFVGFAILMFGMSLMTSAVEPLADSPQFTQVLTYFKSPILGVLTGAVFTGVIQSSSASVGILQALSMTGGITFGAAIPIIMGQNIGTCVTSLISSVGASKNAKRVSVVHILFNLIGTLIFLVAVYGTNLLFPLHYLENTISPVEVALVHSIFNVSTTLLLLPFGKLLVKLSTVIIRGGNEKQSVDFALIDERLFITPSIAVGECFKMAKDMFATTRKQVGLAVQSITEMSPETGKSILENEDMIDIYEDRLGTYLVRLSDGLSDADRKKTAQLLRAIGDMERISDHCTNVLASAQELQEKSVAFSQYANADLAVVASAIEEIVRMTQTAFEYDDAETAQMIEPLEEVIDRLRDATLARHIDRLQKGLCTIELGFIISNILTNYERIADHCSNLGVGVVKANEKEMQMDYHEYTHALRSDQEEYFKNAVAIYAEKFVLPEAGAEG